MAAAGHGQTTSMPYCDLFQCFCCWRVSCSDSIHRFAPGMDYLRRIRDGGANDDRPMRSVLVGCTCADEKLHNLRLHRFRVATSGRVIGHSNDILELFSSVHPDDDANTVFADATASLAPGGGRLNIICSQWPIPEKLSSTKKLDQLPPKAVTVDLVNRTLSPETPLMFLRGAYHAISAHGEFWAAAVVADEEFPANVISWRLVVHRRLDSGGGGSWDEVASYNFPERPEPVDQALFAGTALPGYAVINNQFILLSIIDSTFFCFNCATGTLTRIRTTGGEASMYERISGRAVHVQGSEEDDGGAIYFVNGTTLFAYKYLPEKEDMPPLEPPVMVDVLWPYYCEGYGFIVQLVGQMLCAVWINMNEACSCATRHVLITTFTVIRSTVTKPKGEVYSIEVLHSTCRRVNMIRAESLGYHHYDTFAILQEYPDDAANAYDTSQPAMSGGLSHPVEDSQEILTCCRNYLHSVGELVWTRGSLVDCKVVTKRDLYFICQVDQHSVLYKISTRGGKLTCDERVLEPKLRIDTVRDGGVSVDFPATWHFVRRGLLLFVIPSLPHHHHYKVDVSNMSHSRLYITMRHEYFSAVFRVGQDIVALGDKLMDVYILDEKTLHWDHWPTSSRTLDLEKNVKISGYVDLGGNTFVISDAETDRSFFLDLGSRQWFAVEPPKVNDWFCLVGLLSGRCIYAKGFIYTCGDEGLVAYELFKDQDGTSPYGLGTPILLEYPWRKFSDRRFMSLEPIGYSTKDIVFCVIEGYFLADSFTNRHSLTATTVIVEREDTPQGTKVPVRINHVDVAVASVLHKDRILTNYAFAL